LFGSDRTRSCAKNALLINTAISLLRIIGAIAAIIVGSEVLLRQR
jgi:hypothetical protein